MNILLEFSKSLHDELDRVFQEGSQRLLTEIVDKVIKDNNAAAYNQQHIELYLKHLNERIDLLLTQKPPQQKQSNTIPEVYHTDVELDQVVEDVTPENIEYDTEEDDDEVVEEEEDDDEVVEEEEDEVVEAAPTGDVVDDETVEDVDEGIAEEEEAVEEEEEVVEEEEAVEEEEVVEEEEGVEEEEAVEEAAEEAAEEDSDALQPLEVDNITYYYDSEGNVYLPNDEGEVGEPVGKYDPETGEFELELTSDSETLTPFTYKGKTYLKDSEDNVYTETGEETSFRYVGGKMVRKV
jgi:hypothetical protein